MSEQLDVLKLVAKRLQQADIAYMISGSIALSYYAQPRLTCDIDIVVALRLEDAARVTNLFAADFIIDYGPGYRVYYAQSGTATLLMLCGGDKTTQAADIRQAQMYWTEYQQRRQHEPPD